MTKDASLFANVSADLRSASRLQSCKLAKTLLTHLQPKAQKIISSFDEDELQQI
jgi:hypothetical protein